MHATQVRAQVHASKPVMIKCKLEHMSWVIEHSSWVIKHAGFNRVHEKKKQALTRDSVLASMNLEMSCTVYMCISYNTGKSALPDI